MKSNGTIILESTQDLHLTYVEAYENLDVNDTLPQNGGLGGSLN